MLKVRRRIDGIEMTQLSLNVSIGTPRSRTVSRSMAWTVLFDYWFDLLRHAVSKCRGDEPDGDPRCSAA